MKLQFSNPIYGGQDPFVCKGPDGRYYAVAESVDSQAIEVFSSDRLTDRGIRRIAYRAAESGPSSADLWAPEIWYLRGKWYIYYAGSSAPGMRNWDTHRMYVLEADEPIGPYRFAGELQLGDHMSIDGTVMELPDGRLYFIYMRKHDHNNCLFIAPMSSPTEISGEPVFLTGPEYPWESDITEGPFPIVRAGKIYLMYAANAAHLPEYCLALMRCNDPQNILDPKSWEKEPEPILTGRGDVYGPGHACIVPSPDGTEEYLVFHSKFDLDNTLPGGWNRVINLLRLHWDEESRPVFDPLPMRGEGRPLPSGEASMEPGGPVCMQPGVASDELAEFGYYRSKTIFYEEDGLLIRGSACPDYGDKVLIRGKVWKDCRIRCTLDSRQGESGLMMRVCLPATGARLWEGVGLYFRDDSWRLVQCADKSFTVLAQGTCSAGQKTACVQLIGNSITIWLDGTVLCCCENVQMPDCGQIGLGTLGGDGWFTELSVDPI